jgi:hypothetical protein
MVYSNAKIRVSGGALAVPVGRAALALGEAESESKQVFRIFFLNREGAVLPLGLAGLRRERRLLGRLGGQAAARDETKGPAARIVLARHFSPVSCG